MTTKDRTLKSNRRHYEAQVLVVPIDPDADSTLDTMTGEGLTGVLVLDDLGAVREVTTRADVVVFLLASLSTYEDKPVATIAELGRAAGNLVAALAVGIDDPTSASERAAMRHLREQVDVLVSVRAHAMAAAFLDVLRGGQRSAA